MPVQNTVTLCSELINRDLRPFILEKAKTYVTDYKIDFSGGYIFAEVHLEVPTLGALALRYRLQVTELIFNRQRHRLTAEYEESLESTGGGMQSMLLKATALTGKLLPKALGMARPKGISADERTITLDFDQLFDFSASNFNFLTLRYLDSRDDMLKLEYALDL